MTHAYEDLPRRKRWRIKWLLLKGLIKMLLFNRNADAERREIDVIFGDREPK